MATWLMLLAPAAMPQMQQLADVSRDSSFTGKRASFRAHREFLAPFPGLPAQGDLNGDGVLDLAVPNGRSNNISVLLGNPDGSFRAPLSVNAGAGAFAVVVADFNGDGEKDIAAATVSGVSIMLSEGGGTFQPPVILPAPILSQKWKLPTLAPGPLEWR